jgi:hypothetical protein
MTTNNIESIETTVIESMESTVVVEISSETNELVETEMAGETDEVKRETKALIQAIKRRAQAEAQSAGTLTRERYLNTIRRTREVIEGKKIIEGDRLQHSWELLQTVMQAEAEKNLHLLLKEVADVVVRCQDATKAAWEAFNAGRHQA